LFDNASNGRPPHRARRSRDCGLEPADGVFGLRLHPGFRRSVRRLSTAEHLGRHDRRRLLGGEYRASDGDALAARYANDTNIPADGARMANVVKRYESGAGDSGAQASSNGPAGGMSGMNGPSTGTGIGTSAPTAAPPQQ
jgi:hypothetical protein